jgi:hypothetical protein
LLATPPTQGLQELTSSPEILHVLSACESNRRTQPITPKISIKKTIFMIFRFGCLLMRIDRVIVPRY